MTNLVSIAAGATLTATSVGITARVLADLGRLQDPEGQIILGAAVLDDIIGLVVLTVVVGLSQGGGVHVLGLARTTGIAVGFLAITLLVGRLVVPSLFQLVSGVKLPGTVTTAAIILVFALAWLADLAGSAVILGAFVAGLLLARTPQAAEIEQGVTHLGHFFVPLFFVVVGAAVDVRVFNPLEKANRLPLLVGSLLIVAAVVGKFLAGYAPVWFRGSKAIIGVGMIPRGEVGLIFAQMGLSSGIFDRSLYSAVTITIMVTTFITPPLLKFLLSRRGNQKPPQPVCGHLSELVSDP
jgi:Kef-type K+ transport system membrane component KefB